MKKIITGSLLKSMDALISAIDAYILKADEDLEEELKGEGFVAVALAVATINELEDEWTTAYNAHCDFLLDQLQSVEDMNAFMGEVWPRIREDGTLKSALHGAFHDRFLALFQACVAGFLALDDPDLLEEGTEILSETAVEFAEEWADQLTDQLAATTKEQINHLLLKCQEEQKNAGETVAAIEASTIRDPGSRARRGALTEALRAENYGQLEAMKQNPAIIEKEWQHTGRHKNKPRPNHVAVSGQRVPVNEPFELEGADGTTYYPQCPHDISLPAGETINCHCLMKSIRDPEWVNIPVEERRALREQYMEKQKQKGTGNEKQS